MKMRGDLWRRAIGIAAIAALAGCGAPETQIVREAGFIDIEPTSYTIHAASSWSATSSAARLFYSLHPADNDAGDAPVIIAWNGGPGASSGLLLGLSTSEITLDPSRTGDAASAEGPAPWTELGHVVYLDARGTGFSYGLAARADDEAVREEEISLRSFNPFVDAADVVRATLRFLDAHPSIADREVIFAGESYGGVRAEIALHMLHFPDRYDAADAVYEDHSLATEIRAQGPIAEQFRRAILLQPRLTTPWQRAAAGDAFDSETSPFDAIAAETGVPFVRCAEQAAACDPYDNGLAFLIAAGRDIYDFEEPANATLETYTTVGERLGDPAILASALGVDLAEVRGLAADERARGDLLPFRTIALSTTEEPLAEALGPIAPFDRYFETELFDLIGEPFSGSLAQSLGIERQHERYGHLFLDDLGPVSFFITNAGRDPVIWTPALPAALARAGDRVTRAELANDAIAITLKDANGDEISREIRFVSYENAGHSVTIDTPERLLDDVRAWLGR